LDQPALDELDRIVSWLDANPLQTEMITPDQFALGQTRKLFEGVRKAVFDGPGFAVVKTLPLERYGKENAVRLYWLLSQLVSRPVAQKFDGTMIYNIWDTYQPAGNGIRPDSTNIAINFHSDNSYNTTLPDVVGLICLQTPLEGGLDKVLSYYSVHNRLQERYSWALPRLYRPFFYDRQREHLPEDSQVISQPLFRWDGEKLHTRFGLFQIKLGYPLVGQDIDQEGLEAIQALEEVLTDSSLWIEHQFEVGELQFFDNREFGHARTAYKDHPDPALKRHLIRLWLRDRGPRTYFA